MLVIQTGWFINERIMTSSVRSWLFYYRIRWLRPSTKWWEVSSKLTNWSLEANRGKGKYFPGRITGSMPCMMTSSAWRRVVPFVGRWSSREPFLPTIPCEIFDLQCIELVDLALASHAPSFAWLSAPDMLKETFASNFGLYVDQTAHNGCLDWRTFFHRYSPRFGLIINCEWLH